MLVWIRKMNNKINRIHERALRLTYSDCSSNFDELPKKDRSFSIHEKHIQAFAIKTDNFFAVFVQI